MNPIKTKAIQYLARREHSEKELQTKLEQHFTNPSQIQQVLAELREENYLSNTRFLESRIRHRLSQGYGRLKISQELTQIHGLKSEEIRAAFAGVPDTESELDRLHQLIQKKYASLDRQNQAEVARLTRKLLQRGFSYALIKLAFQAEC